MSLPIFAIVAIIGFENWEPLWRIILWQLGMWIIGKNTIIIGGLIWRMNESDRWFSPTVVIRWKLIHTVMPDTTKLSYLCELSRPVSQTGAFCVYTVVCVRVCPAAQCDRRTHSEAERTCPAVSSHRHTSQDKTAAPASRPPPRRRPGRQLRSSLPTAHTQRRCTPRKC